jgi:hypothetical protein
MYWYLDGWHKKPFEPCGKKLAQFVHCIPVLVPFRHAGGRTLDRRPFLCQIIPNNLVHGLDIVTQVQRRIKTDRMRLCARQVKTASAFVLTQ